MWGKIFATKFALAITSGLQNSSPNKQFQNEVMYMHFKLFMSSFPIQKQSHVKHVSLKKQIFLQLRHQEVCLT